MDILRDPPFEFELESIERVKFFHFICRSSHQRCSVKKVFLEISQNSQENTCARVSFLIKLQATELQLYLKRVSDTGIFL